MKNALKIVRAIIILILGLALLLVGSIAVDALVGRDRLSQWTNTEIDNPDGPGVGAYVAKPAGQGPFPAVIMIHEFWGLNEEIVGKAEALANEGFFVVAPDTYRGVSTRWIPRAIFQVVVTPQERVDSDLDAVFNWMTQQPEVRSDRIMVMGFCYGGGKALRYSLHNEELAATAVFYGAPIDDADVLRSLPGPVLGIFGTADVQISVEQVNAFEAALDHAGIPNQISLYQDQPHAFVTDIDSIRQGGPQGAAWDEFVTFLANTLIEE